MGHTARRAALLVKHIVCENAEYDRAILEAAALRRLLDPHSYRPIDGS